MATGNLHLSGSDVPDYDRLCMAMKSATYSLRQFRENRASDVRDYVGNNWSENALDTPKQMVNVIDQFIEIVGKQLVANNPRMMLSTINPTAKPVVAKLEMGVNSIIKKMDLSTTLKRVNVDACFSVGICKVGICDPGHAAKMGWRLKAGDCAAHVVDLDDFVFDQHARDFRECSFIGHRFRMPLQVAREFKQFNAKQRKELSASEDRRFNAEGDEKITSLGRAYTGDTTEFDPMVDLWEVYLPRHGLVVTMELDPISGYRSGDQHDLLRVQKWIGPVTGPYHILGFGTVPDNAMPKSPIQRISPMNTLLNNMWRKLDRQAQRLKSVTLIRGTADADGNRQVKASDGDAIRVDDPESAREVTMGGPNPVLFQFAEQTRAVLNVMAGNLELMGGGAAQSPTEHQDAMLNENSGKVVAGMQQDVVRFVSGVGESIAWFEHHNPSKVIREEFLHPGLPANQGFEQVRTLSPEERQHVPWEDMEIKVDPYSLPYQTPQSRMTTIDGIVQQLAPFMQILQQQGRSLDLAYYLQLKAKYSDMPDLERLFMSGQPPPATDDGQGDPNAGMGGPAEKTTNIVRRSLGANSPANQQNNRMNLMGSMGGSANGVNPQMNGKH